MTTGISLLVTHIHDIYYLEADFSGYLMSVSLNKDISFNIPFKFMKFKIHVLEGHSEGTMSQIFDLGLSFYFMQSRKKD